MTQDLVLCTTTGAVRTITLNRHPPGAGGTVRWVDSVRRVSARDRVGT